MGIDTKVDFESLQRQESDGNVTGQVVLRVYGDLFGISFDQTLEKKDFDFPRGGEQEVYRQELGIDKLKLTITAKVHERTAGQCCVQGHAHVDGPIGGGIGKDLDPNCHPIP